MAWWQSRCPVRPAEQAWIDESMTWFVDEFGRERLLGPVVLPTDDYFPGTYEGSPADVESVLRSLCGHMDVDPDRIILEFEDSIIDESDRLSAHVGLHRSSTAPAGHHRMRGARSVVSIREDLPQRPMALVATIAHELGHVLLLADERVPHDREDHEPLTDLLTVYFGLGVFGANAAFDFRREHRGEYTYTSTSRTGYLTEPMFGYGLARYAWLRGETEPEWAGHLDTNPQAFLKQGLRYLRQAAADDR